jgi:uncharacterized protein
LLLNAAWLPYAIIILALWLLLETYIISASRVYIDVGEWDQAPEGLCMVQLSDFHGKYFSSGGRLMKTIKEAKPDMIALTGDYVHKNSEEILRLLPFFAELTSVAPVYAVGGNHDYKAGWPFIAGHLKKTGIRVLENTHETLIVNNITLVVAGVHDPATGRDRPEAALPEKSDSPVIMLAHAPTWYEQAYVGETTRPGGLNRLRKVIDSILLTLAGHTHGGQIKLPLVGAVVTGKRNWFPKRYIQGLYKEGKGWLYISRGLGQGRPLPVRFLSRPELVILTLRKKEERKSI